MASEIVKPADLRAKTNDELDGFIRNKLEELFKLRFQHFTGQLENVARLKQVRREVARAKTIAAEKSRGSQVQETAQS